MAAVELAHGKEVQRGDQQADPTGKGHGVKKDIIAGPDPPEDQRAEYLESAGFAEEDGRLIPRQGRHDLGQGQADGQRGHGRDESGQRPGRPDVEQRALAGDGIPDSDESAHRSDQGRGRDEERQGGAKPVATAGPDNGPSRGPSG